jgi:hypothetical protein
MPTPPALIETPTGDLALPFLGVATALSNSTTFQAMVGAANPAAALPFIDYPLRDTDSYGDPIPGAIICDEDSLRMSRPRLKKLSGQLLIELFDEMNPTYYGNGTLVDWRNDNIAMRNRFGAILFEILIQTPYLAITQWQKVGAPTHTGAPEYLREDPNAQKWYRYGAFVVDFV